MDDILDRLSALETVWRLTCPLVPAGDSTGSREHVNDLEPDIQNHKGVAISRVLGVIEELISEAMQEKTALSTTVLHLQQQTEQLGVTLGIPLALEPFFSVSNLPQQQQKYEQMLRQLEQMGEWMRERRQFLLEECRQMLEEEESSEDGGALSPSLEPLPSWVCDTIRGQCPGGVHSDVVAKLDAEAMAIQSATLNDLLTRLEEAYELLKGRLGNFNAESAALWEELQSLHTRLHPFEPDRMDSNCERISRILLDSDPSIERPRMPRSTLRRVAVEWRRAEQDRAESVGGSILLIGRLWDLLETLPQERFPLDPHDISLANMARLLAERRRLIDFQQHKFRELYDAHLAELGKLMHALRWSPRRQTEALGSLSQTEKYTAEGLQLLSRQIATLRPKLELTETLHAAIATRAQLIEQMRQFERSASDPARLFRSSFQLLHEEKFRKTALPSLLAQETRLRGQLAEFKRRFREDFCVAATAEEERPFIELLEEEVAGRYLNEGIFGFDQAKNRKERMQSKDPSSGPANGTTFPANTPRYSAAEATGRRMASLGTPMIPQRRSSSRLDK